MARIKRIDKILNFIKTSKKELTIQEIGKSLNLDVSNVSKEIKKLERSGAILSRYEQIGRAKYKFVKYNVDKELPNSSPIKKEARKKVIQPPLQDKANSRDVGFKVSQRFLGAIAEALRIQGYSKMNKKELTKNIISQLSELLSEF
ncbi:MAG: winged helix-turn-helix domain-containing protein [Candidatus Helarchaeota archaeon]